MASHNYRVGDEFEGSPIQLNQWVTPVWAAGGRVEFDGEIATIVYLPEEPEEEVEEVVIPEEKLEEVAIEPASVEEVKEEVAVEPAVVEEVQPVKAYTRSPGRPKKVSEEN